jgi:hypothetical protein
MLNWTLQLLPFYLGKRGAPFFFDYNKKKKARKKEPMICITR